MLTIYKTEDGQLKRIQEATSNAWIKLTRPTMEECAQVARAYDIELADVRAALDDEESSRIEREPGYTLVLIDISIDEVRNDRLSYTTIPLGIIVLPTVFITVCAQESNVLTKFLDQGVRNFSTEHRNRMASQMVLQIALDYQRRLRRIDRARTDIEEKINDKTMKENDLMDLHELESSLVYFATSLRKNAVVLKKMHLAAKARHADETNIEMLEDAITENEQAIEMTSIYRDIIEGTSTLLSTIMDNRLNDVMKYLTSITLVLAIPTIIGGIWGMNVPVPMQSSPYGFAVICISMVVSCIIALIILYRKNML
ncbi:MAG: magnesium transporter CorA family protein [Lachnospiraceae bacterium]|nr:magnesium transporter CorA family protein [Lachnospiraceae bacterium]